MSFGVHISGPSEWVPPAEIERAERDPDAYDVCCAGAAMRGVDHCTCWEPVFDLDQVEELQEGPAECRAKCCHDCAYRNGSPERDDEHGDERLMDAATGAQATFWCHQGVRRVVEWRHPDGRVLPAGEGDYRPPQLADRIFRADGRPGELCAGWRAHRDFENLGPTILHRARLPEWVG